MNRRDDPFERASSSFWPSSASDFGMDHSVVEDLARRDYFLRGHVAASSTSGGGNSPFSDLGAFASVPPSSSSAFPYSQKNFHISDGTLYSVLSPFQARKSSARPAFLRGQSCVTSTSISSSSSSMASSSSSSVRHQHHHQQQQQEPSGGRRSSKLKFHHQDMPPPYGERSRRHPQSRPGDGGDPGSSWSDVPPSNSSSFGRDPFCGLRSDEDFLLSKRLKSPHRTQRFRRTVDDEDEDRLFRSSNTSELRSEDFSSRSFRQQHHQQQQRHRHRRRSSSTTTDGSRTAVNSSMVDVDDEDEEEEASGPLNLCMADYRRQLESRIKSDFESDCETSREAESDAEGFPFRKWPVERKFGLSELFDAFPAKFSAGAGSSSERFKSAFEDEPRVLDLSTKEHAAKSASAFRPSTLLAASAPGDLGYGDSFFVQSCQVPPDAKSKRFAPISEMLENMRLQDSGEDFRHNALERYLSARERLVHTHPEMFGGWERETCAPPEKPPPDAKPAFVPKESLLDVGPPPAKVAPDRPRSWDVAPAGPAPHVPDTSSSHGPPVAPDLAATTRPDSAEPCLESGPFVPAPVYEPAPETSRLDEGRPAPHGPVLCASCPEVPSMGATASHGAARPKHHPKTKIKSEGAIGGTQRPKTRPLRKSGSAGGMAPDSQSPSSQYTNQDISICKFKLTKGVHPVLEEKKSFFVPMPRPPQPKPDEGASCSGMSGPQPAGAADKFRTFKIHVGSQEDMGRKLACGNKRLRRRSQKALVREKLEATFREQGFLIKTQQVSSAEGAVYCKFRQLKKFTRYLYKSWKDHLPKELDDISRTQQGQQPQPPGKESS